MMRAVLRRMWFAGAALAAFAVGCNPQDYVGDPSLHSFALDENTAPLLMAEDTAFYFIESRFEIPLLRPTDAQIRALYETPAPPFPRSPWVDRDDLPMEVDWTLTNLADTPIDATLTLNGINEFHEYMPSFEADDDEVVIGFSQWERTYALEAFETRGGTIREEELDEVAVDLATVVNGAPNPNLIVYFENQSDHDPRAADYIPDVIPGLVGFRMGLETQAQARLVVEFTVRVRDAGERLVDPADDPMDVWRMPPPEVFVAELLEEGP